MLATAAARLVPGAGAWPCCCLAGALALLQQAVL